MGLGGNGSGAGARVAQWLAGVLAYATCRKVGSGVRIWLGCMITEPAQASIVQASILSGWV